MGDATNSDTLTEIHLIYKDKSKNVKITGFKLGETAPLKDGDGASQEETKERDVPSAVPSAVPSGEGGGGRTGDSVTDSRTGGKKSRKPKSKRIRVRKTRRRKH